MLVYEALLLRIEGAFHELEGRDHVVVPELPVGAEGVGKYLFDPRENARVPVIELRAPHVADGAFFPEPLMHNLKLLMLLTLNKIDTVERAFYLDAPLLTAAHRADRRPQRGTMPLRFTLAAARALHRTNLQRFGSNILSDPIDNFIGRDARLEESLDTLRLEIFDIFLWNYTAPENRNAAYTLLLQKTHDLGENIIMSARQYAEPHGVNVFLERRLDYRLRRIMEPRINDFESRVPERPRDYLYSPVVTVQARFPY